MIICESLYGTYAVQAALKFLPGSSDGAIDADERHVVLRLRQRILSSPAKRQKQKNFSWVFKVLHGSWKCSCKYNTHEGVTIHEGIYDYCGTIAENNGVIPGEIEVYNTFAEEKCINCENAAPVSRHSVDGEGPYSWQPFVEAAAGDVPTAGSGPGGCGVPEEWRRYRSPAY